MYGIFFIPNSSYISISKKLYVIGIIYQTGNVLKQIFKVVLVEKAVQIVYSCILAPLRDRDFFSLEQLKRAIKELLEICNNKFFQNQSISRKQKFDREEKH